MLFTETGLNMEPPHPSSPVDLAAELQRIYDSELNIEISWLWDGGIDLRLGDRMNGFLAEENVSSIADVIGWFQEAIAHFYPNSTYAKGLDPKVHSRMARRLFRSPIFGARVTCPHCGASNANPERMEEVLCFVCLHCGTPVQIGPPQIQ